MPHEITRLLREGPAAEAELWPIVYGELKALARAVLRGRRKPGGPQTTTLVHEAYLRLVGFEAGAGTTAANSTPSPPAPCASWWSTTPAGGSRASAAAGAPG